MLPLFDVMPMGLIATIGFICWNKSPKVNSIFNKGSTSNLGIVLLVLVLVLLLLVLLVLVLVLLLLLPLITMFLRAHECRKTGRERVAHTCADDGRHV